MFLVAFTGSVKYNRRMNDITKNKIARTSELLFNAHGYNNVTMRQIADACGISVGNLTYHYPKKEDLLMLEHDGIMNSFLDRVFAGCAGISRWKQHSFTAYSTTRPLRASMRRS